MTNLEAAIAKMNETEAARVANPTYENTSAANRAYEAWQIAAYA